MRKTIAVDFDGCLCEAKWPDIGEPRQQVINELIKQQADGAKLILWTCREGHQLQAAVMWCLNHGLKFDAVNDNLEENKEYFGNNSRKVWANEYWDDKSVLVVNAGEVTSIVAARTEGGMVIKKWMNGSLQLVRNPLEPGKKPEEKPEKKRWWQFWR